MILQIRGTSGSGKSYVMRKIMEGMEWVPTFIPGRKKPLLYTHPRGIVTLGHYESPCGGCDTIGSARQVYDLIQEVLDKKEPKLILCEGLLLSEDSKWSKQLTDLKVVYLNTPIPFCLANIRRRRAEASNEKPLNPDNTVNRVAAIERSRVKLTEVGKCCVRCSPMQAIKIGRKEIQKCKMNKHG